MSTLPWSHEATQASSNIVLNIPRDQRLGDNWLCISTVDRLGRDTEREREHGPTPWLTAQQRSRTRRDRTTLHCVVLLRHLPTWTPATPTHVLLSWHGPTGRPTPTGFEWNTPSYANGTPQLTNADSHRKKTLQGHEKVVSSMRETEFNRREKNCRVKS